MNKFRWKSIIPTVILVVLISFFDVGTYVFNRDQGLWEQSGWKSYKVEHVKRVEFLLWLGADPAYVNIDDSQHLSVLENAVEWFNPEIIDILLPLLPEEAHSHAMDYACRRGPGMSKVIAFLSEKGITPSRSVESEELKATMPSICSEAI